MAQVIPYNKDTAKKITDAGREVIDHLQEQMATMPDGNEEFFDNLEDDDSFLDRFEECTDVPMTREEYEKDWWKKHRENKDEMRRLCMTLLFKHTRDDCEQMELEYNFDRMFDSGPEPEPIQHGLTLGDGDDAHCPTAIGNMMLMTENYWGDGGLYRRQKFYNPASPCLNVLFKVDDDEK